MLHYLRKHTKIRKINGFILQFPKGSLDPKIKNKEVLG
jgi:hypothetical protein